MMDPPPSAAVARMRRRRRRVLHDTVKSHRVKVRWLGGHPPPSHWIDEAWKAVWG
jgi:hypothetical protein